MEALNVCKDSLISMEIEILGRLRPGLNSFHGELLCNWITTQKAVSTCEDRSMYIFCDSVVQKNYYLLKNETDNHCFNGFYVKTNLPQYPLTVTNLLEYKINIID